MFKEVDLCDLLYCMVEVTFTLFQHIIACWTLIKQWAAPSTYMYLAILYLHQTGKNHSNSDLYVAVLQSKDYLETNLIHVSIFNKVNTMGLRSHSNLTLKYRVLDETWRISHFPFHDRASMMLCNVNIQYCIVGKPTVFNIKTTIPPIEYKGTVPLYCRQIQ